MEELRENSKTVRKVLSENESKSKLRHIVATTVESADGKLVDIKSKCHF